MVEIDKKIKAVKHYLNATGLTCGEDIYQRDIISAESHYILDRVLTILFGEDYDLEEE